MGAWALKQACQEAATWPEHIKVTVNLSSVQFEHGDLFKDVKDALSFSGLHSDRLELEITESVLLRDDAKTHKLLHKLRTLGVKFALDDFGTAYASLSYLRSFPFDKIKIDRTFIADLGNPKRKDCIAIIHAVAGLAKQMQMSTVAEGVETLDQLDTVTLAGCEEVQGFYFSKPVPAGEVKAAITSCCDMPRVHTKHAQSGSRARKTSAHPNGGTAVMDPEQSKAGADAPAMSALGHQQTSGSWRRTSAAAGMP